MNDGHIIDFCSPYTKTGHARLSALISAVRSVCENGVEGDIVECGVWRGGSMMAAAMALQELDHSRALHLFDTFDGMPPPGVEDVDHRGVHASAFLAQERKETGEVFSWSPLEDVRKNMAATGYPQELVRFVKGMVEDTIPSAAPETIAILRLDTDWYASTKHELENLYPRLSVGGVLIIDDYGHWGGARKAVDEYFAGGVELTAIDYTGRVLTKR